MQSPDAVDRVFLATVSTVTERSNLIGGDQEDGVFLAYSHTYSTSSPA